MITLDVIKTFHDTACIFEMLYTNLRQMHGSSFFILHRPFLKKYLSNFVNDDSKMLLGLFS